MGGFRVIAVYDGTQELLAENPDVPPTPEAVTDGGGGLVIGLAIAGAVVFSIILGAGLCWWRHRLFSRGMELKDAQRRSTSGGETPMEDVVLWTWMTSTSTTSRRRKARSATSSRVRV